MARPSRLQLWLNKFPAEERDAIEQKTKLAPTITRAHAELKKLGYKGSYDSVQSWRASATRQAQGIGQQSANAYQMAANLALEDNPIEAAVSLAKQLNQLCLSLADLLQRHDWLEGQECLTNRDAIKVLGLLAPLSRASVGSLLELSQVKSKIDERLYAEALLAELSEDWRRIVQHDNPELTNFIEPIIAATKSRLELDRPSALEVYLQEHGERTVSADDIA